MPITIKIDAEDLDPDGLEECIREAKRRGMIEHDDGAAARLRREVEDAYELLVNGDAERGKTLLGQALFPDGGNIILARLACRQRGVAA